jgi:N-acetyl-anhydromuramyl-L-alanine amidase AmpD
MTDSPAIRRSSGPGGPWLFIPPLLVLLFLSGCSWLPLFKQQSSDEDLINRLLYEMPDPTPRPPGQQVKRSRTDKQLSLLPSRPAGEVSFQRSLDLIQRCLSSQGIPSETLQAAHPTNYDRRLRLDAAGRPVDRFPMIIVLHETVASEEDTLNLFRTPHNDESAQASYHMIIPDDGRRVRIVADQDRAFGAGNSTFGNYTIRLKADSPGSINNIALHLSLVSPADGRGEAPTHSGYSPRQYRSAAAQALLWQTTYGIPFTRLTTHKAVDQSQTRTDPRSFDWSQFVSAHTQLATSCGLQAFAADRSSHAPERRLTTP